MFFPHSICSLFTYCCNCCIDLTYWVSVTYQDEAKPLNEINLFPRLMFIHLYCCIYNIAQVRTPLAREFDAPSRLLRGTYLVTSSCFHPDAIRQLYESTKRWMSCQIDENIVIVLENYIRSLFTLLKNENTNTQAFKAGVEPANRMTEDVILSVFQVMKDLNIFLSRYKICIDLLAPFQVAYDVAVIKMSFGRIFRQFVKDTRAGFKCVIPLQTIVQFLKPYFAGNDFRRSNSKILYNLRYLVHDDKPEQRQLEELCRAFMGPTITPSNTSTPMIALHPRPLSFTSITSSVWDEEDKENIVAIIPPETPTEITTEYDPTELTNESNALGEASSSEIATEDQTEFTNEYNALGEASLSLLSLAGWSSTIHPSYEDILAAAERCNTPNNY
jgi:hypothetical protein